MAQGKLYIVQARLKRYLSWGCRASAIPVEGQSNIVCEGHAPVRNGAGVAKVLDSIEDGQNPGG